MEKEFDNKDKPAYSLDYLKDYFIQHGWEVYDYPEDGAWEIERKTPLGLDYSINIEHGGNAECAILELENYVDEFDIYEKADLFINDCGARIPDALLEDMKWILERLNELAPVLRLIQAEKEERSDRCAAIRVYFDDLHVVNAFANSSDVEKVCANISAAPLYFDDDATEYWKKETGGKKPPVVTFEIDDDGPEVYEEQEIVPYKEDNEQHLASDEFLNDSFEKASPKKDAKKCMFRVVLTCWEPHMTTPYADDLSGVKLSLFENEQEALEEVKACVKQELAGLNWLDGDDPREKEPIEDSDGNIIGYDYPFREDDSGEHVNIIRFWDGDDYQNVTAYDIYGLHGDNGNLEECSAFRYREFSIIRDKIQNSFKVERSGKAFFSCSSLQEALRKIDDVLCTLKYKANDLQTKISIATLSNTAIDSDRPQSPVASKQR